MKETEFAYRIRQALNEGAERLDYRTVYRLEQARGRALARYRPGQQEAPAWVPSLQPAAAGAPSSAAPGGFWTWLHRAGLAAPIAVLIIGFVGIYQWQRTQTIEHLADLDFAVLLDENPIDTYAESGFGVLLKNQEPSN
jgi:hypothetical protein